jgi:hypothetical protein
MYTTRSFNEADLHNEITDQKGTKHDDTTIWKSQNIFTA